MKTIRRFFWAHLLIASIGLAVGLGLAGGWQFSLAAALIGAAWFAGQRRGKGPVNGWLFIFLLGSVLGILLNGEGWLLLLAAVAALGAWDLDHFLRRLMAVERVEYTSGLGRNHLRRLALAEGLGFTAGLPALYLQLNIAFGWVTLLALLAVIAISRIVAYVRRQAE